MILLLIKLNLFSCSSMNSYSFLIIVCLRNVRSWTSHLEWLKYDFMCPLSLISIKEKIYVRYSAKKSKHILLHIHTYVICNKNCICSIFSYVLGAFQDEIINCLDVVLRFIILLFSITYQYFWSQNWFSRFSYLKLQYLKETN